MKGGCQKYPKNLILILRLCTQNDLVIFNVLIEDVLELCKKLQLMIIPC